MQSALRFFPAALLAWASASSFASTTVYTTAGTFLPLVAAGSYTENFNGLANPPSGSFASGGFQYVVSAPGSLYASGEFLGTNLPNDALTITFSSGNVTAVGGNFYATNISDVFQPVSMSLTLSDGTLVSLTPASVSASYRGFISTLAITSLVISAPGASLYAGLDNLTVGRASAVVPAVPEPTTWALMGLGLAGIIVARRKA